MWKAKLKNNEVVSELTHNWNDIKDNVTELILLTKNQQLITLPKNMEKYIHLLMGSSDLGSDKIEVEGRIIGFKIGNITIKVRVHDKTNNISIEIDDDDN